MADGSIIINTEIDDKQAQKELDRLNRKIQTLNDQIYVKQQQRMPLVEQPKELAAQLDLANSKLHEMQSTPGNFSAEAIKEQQETVRALETEWNRVQSQVEKYDAGIQKSTAELNLAKEQAGAVQQQMAATGPVSERMAAAMDRMQKSANRFSMRLREVVRSALVFTVISRGLASLREWLGRVVRSNDEAVAAISKLKGALLTLAQPLINILIPAFTAFLNVLTQVISSVAGFVSSMFGATIEQSKEAANGLYEETEALEGAGAAAESVGKSLASFDQINKLSASGSGAGGSASAETAPDFSFDTGETKGMLGKILDLVKLIGTALLYWKLPKSLQGGIKTLIGLFLSLDGVIGFVKSTWDAWQNGVTGENVLSMIARAAELALGLFIALGPKLGPVAAGISLIVTGLTMLVTGFYDAYLNGWNLQNLLLSIAGILASGIGISLLTSSWIPLLISGITSIVLAITTAYGQGEELIAGIKDILSGFIDFFVGVFTGDFEQAVQGITKIFEGIKGVISAVLEALRSMFDSFLDWLDEKTGGKISGIVEFVRSTLNGAIDWIKSSISGLVDSLKTILSGITEFLSGVFTGDWDEAWRGLCNTFIGLITGLIAAVESFINFFVEGINTVISAINTLSFDVPDWVPGIGGQTWGFNIPKVPSLEFGRIPELARGAAIPPNREFLAVLGDQKQGTNIETPLSTMMQAFRTALAEDRYSGGQVIENVVMLDGEIIYRNQKNVARRHGVSLVDGR